MKYKGRKLDIYKLNWTKKKRQEKENAEDEGDEEDWEMEDEDEEDEIEALMNMKPTIRTPVSHASLGLRSSKQ